MTSTSTFADAICLDDLDADPYPIYRHLRRSDPVAWVPALQYYLLTRFEDVDWAERNSPEVFSSDENPSVVKRAMGPIVGRKDGPAHRRQRASMESTFKPNTIKNTWAPIFRQNADDLVDGLIKRGSADLLHDFMAPLAARNLASLFGLRGVSDDDMLAWSQAIIDGASNHANNPDIWARTEAVRVLLDAAIDEAVERLAREPDLSVISAILQAQDPLSPEEFRANIRQLLAAGINEPRDVGAVSTWALLTHLDQRAAVEAEPDLWRRVFEESVRWLSPVGLLPRTVVRDVEVGGIALTAGVRVGLVLASANRDERRYDDPDSFDIHRPVTGHIGFGAGPHFCLGAWMARISMGQIAVPTLFGRIPSLVLEKSEPVRWTGWVFRGPRNLPVRWTTAWD